MARWKAGPEKPRTRFCWDCSRQLHGRAHATIVGEDGATHDVHKACVKGRAVVGGSTTTKTEEMGNDDARGIRVRALGNQRR